MDSRIPGYYDGVAPDRDSALEILNNMENWTQGGLFSIMYVSSEDHQINNIDDINVILAVGIKNSNECGPGNNQSENLWLDRSLNHGPQFYKVIGDSGSIEPSPSPIPLPNLHTTTVEVNTATYDVLNANGQDETVEDPFRIEQLPRVIK